MIKVNELFSGIGAFRKALERLNIPHEIVGISEIDKYAIKSYEAIYGETRNYGDISKVDKLDYADLWTYGFPCQDISVAGQQKGIVKGETRSGLLYEVQRLLTTSAMADELPKYLILENVKNLVGKKFKADFDSWLEWLGGIGYNNYWQVINAKDCSIPQNRERVFVVSIRKDIDTGFTFPHPIPLTTTMADFLEDEVDAKKLCKTLRHHKALQYLTNQDISICLGVPITKVEHWFRQDDCFAIPDAEIWFNLKQLLGIETTEFDDAIMTFEEKEGVFEKSERHYFVEGLSPTLTSMSGQEKIIVSSRGRTPDNPSDRKARIKLEQRLEPTCSSSYRIRKLTPKECWRLMGFDDADFEKAEKVCSNTQLYKQAGNSIVVNVLEGILGALLPKPSRSEWLDELLGG